MRDRPETVARASKERQFVELAKFWRPFFTLRFSVDERACGFTIQDRCLKVRFKEIDAYIVKHREGEEQGERGEGGRGENFQLPAPSVLGERCRTGD